LTSSSGTASDLKLWDAMKLEISPVRREKQSSPYLLPPLPLLLPPDTFLEPWFESHSGTSSLTIGQSSILDLIST